MRNFKKNKIIETAIEALSSKGNGIGVFNNADGSSGKIEVPFTIPGDKVRALLLKKKRGLYSSLFEEMIEPSPRRLIPKCIHFGLCGGCRWQQLPYEDQLKHKETFIRHCLAPHLTHHVQVKPILAAKPSWNYRNKMEFSFSSDAAKNQYVGLHIDSGRGKVFNLTECHLVNSWMADAVKAIREWWKEQGLEAYHPYRNSGSLRNLTTREGIRTGDRMVMLTVSGNPDYALKRHHLEGLVAFLRAAVEPDDPNSHFCIFLRIQQIAKGIPTQFFEMHLHGQDHIREILHIALDKEAPPQSLQFKISPAAFFQPNTFQAEQLYSAALSGLNLNEKDSLFDLYCGTGALGICAARKVKEVVGIEWMPESTLDAEENAAVNGLNNIIFHTGSVPAVLRSLREEKRFSAPSVVVVDPPRVGLDPSTIQQMLELNPEKILYVSCNPVTQSQNLTDLIAGGYTCEVVQPVDQFPQTPHVENIVILKKK
jgi:23S rRNA (uracil1939-C5)-methyltransferase